jgi:O-antigen/teichoic acid export membrane protein
VRFLGRELYGQWVVILSLTSYFGLANLGMAQTVGNLVAEAAAKAQTRLLGNVVSTAFFFHALVAIPLLLLSALVASGYFAHLLPMHTPAAEVALAVTCFFAALSLPLKVSSMTLRSLNRVDLEQTTQMFSNLARAAAWIVVLLLGLRLRAVAVVHGLALMAPGIASYIIVAEVAGGARPSITLFSWRLLEKMLVPSAAFFVLTVASTMAFSIDNVVIAYTLGTQAVTRYSVPCSVVMLFNGFFAVALGALMPVITDHHARGARDVLLSGYALAVRAAILFGAGTTIFLWLAGEQLLRLWVGAGIFPGYATFGLQLALLFIQVLLCPAHTILMATSNHYGYAIWAITEGILNLILSLWWVRVWGLPGVIAGTVAARLLTNGWYMPAAAMRAIGLAGSSFCRSIGRSAVVAVPGLTFAALAPILWPLLAEKNGILIACAASLAFCVGFLVVEPTSAERRSLLEALAGRRGGLVLRGNKERTA